MTRTYIPLLRPASFCTVPAGVAWEYVEAPSKEFANRPDLPQSQHRFGVIRTDRPLTADEIRAFDMRPI